MSDAGNTNNTPPNWVESLPEDVKVHAVNRGLNQKSPQEAAALMIQAHRDAMAEITRLHNTSNAVRLPEKPDDVEGWNNVYKRLGKPDTLDGYKLEGLKFADGSDPDEQFIGSVKQIAHELNLPADKAAALAQKIMGLADADEQKEYESIGAMQRQAEAELHRVWGAQHDYFSFQVGRAMDLLGMDTEVAELARASGPEIYVKFMQGMRGLASKMGEAQMLRGDAEGRTGSTAYTPQQAEARLAELKSNSEWSKRFVRGEQAARDEFRELAAVIAAARLPAGQSANTR